MDLSYILCHNLVGYESSRGLGTKIAECGYETSKPGYESSGYEKSMGTKRLVTLSHRLPLLFSQFRLGFCKHPSSINGTTIPLNLSFKQRIITVRRYKDSATLRQLS